jgi:hypothetical protein
MISQNAMNFPIHHFRSAASSLVVSRSRSGLKDYSPRTSPLLAPSSSIAGISDSTRISHYVNTTDSLPPATLRRDSHACARGNAPSGSFRVLLGSLGRTEPAAPPAPGSRATGQTGVDGGGRTTPSWLDPWFVGVDCRPSRNPPRHDPRGGSAHRLGQIAKSPHRRLLPLDLGRILPDGQTFFENLSINLPS